MMQPLDHARTVGWRLAPARAAAVLLAVAGVLPACSPQDKTGEFYTQWDLAGGCTSSGPGAHWRDAHGQARDVCDRSGAGWTWVTYAAPWCKASRQQAGVMARFAQAASPVAEVYAVLTSGDEVFQPPRAADAQAWAGAYGLPPQQVLFDLEANPRTTPQHLLIGPDGKTWYRWIGYLAAEDMQELLAAFAAGLRPPQVRKLPAR